MNARGKLGGSTDTIINQSFDASRHDAIGISSTDKFVAPFEVNINIHAIIQTQDGRRTTTVNQRRRYNPKIKTA